MQVATRTYTPLTRVMTWIDLCAGHLLIRSSTSGTFALTTVGYSDPTVNAQTCIAHCTNSYGPKAIAATKGETCNMHQPCHLVDGTTDPCSLQPGPFRFNIRFFDSVHSVVHLPSARSMWRIDNVPSVRTDSGACSLLFPPQYLHPKLCSRFSISFSLCNNPRDRVFEEREVSGILDENKEGEARKNTVASVQSGDRALSRSRHRSIVSNNATPLFFP
jgi:hypothetical protein